MDTVQQGSLSFVGSLLRVTCGSARSLAKSLIVYTDGSEIDGKGSWAMVLLAVLGVGSKVFIGYYGDLVHTSFCFGKR